MLSLNMYVSCFKDVQRFSTCDRSGSCICVSFQVSNLKAPIHSLVTEVSASGGAGPALLLLVTRSHPGLKSSSQSLQILQNSAGKTYFPSRVSWLWMHGC